MKKKSKIIVVLVLSFLMVSLSVVSAFATSVAPFEGLPLNGYDQETHYPQFNYNYSWWGMNNINDGTTFYATQYLGCAPIIYGDMATIYDIGNGTNTFSSYGGVRSYIQKFLNAKSRTENILRWCNRCYSVIPSTFRINAENTLTPPQNPNNSIVKFPIFDFIFNPNGVIGDGNIVIEVSMRFRLYTYDSVGEFVTIEPFSILIPSTAFSRYVGGDIGYQDQPCFSINMTDILTPILYDNGWDSTQGIYWEYINVDFADVSIPNINGGGEIDFVFYETVSYIYNDYDFELLAYNGAVETYLKQVGYNNGYGDGYNKGQHDGTAEGFENGYKVGYKEGESFLMIVPNFLEGVVEPFFNLEIFPNFSIGALLSVLVGAFVVLWILKLIAGG